MDSETNSQTASQMTEEKAQSLLVEYAEGSLPSDLHQAVEEQLQRSEELQAEYEAITNLQSMAINWHEEQPPAWKIPEIEHTNPMTEWLDGFRNWFPTFASATALVLVSVMYFDDSAESGQLPQSQVASGAYESLPELPQAQQAAFVDSVLETSREQRQEEFSALLEYITAEMNRRSIETEESMRFILSSQIEGQKELDQLYQQIERLALENKRENAAKPGEDALPEGL